MRKQIRCRSFLATFGFAAVLAFTPAAFGSDEGGHGGGHGETGHGAADPAPKSPGGTLQTVLEGNNRFKHEHPSHSFDAYQQGQTPGLTVISCADSRVHTPLFGEDPHNNIFIIRNIGNQIRNSEGSVDYGVLHLPTKVLLIMGHSSCGAVKAAMGDYSGETVGIKAELEPIRPVIATDDGQAPFEKRWARNVEKNVDYQVAYALNLYGDKVRNGELAVVGGVYDFNDNYGKGRGTLVITNINGETDPNAIMRQPVLQEVEQSVVVTHVGSLAPTLE